MSRRRTLALFGFVFLVACAYALWRAPEWGGRLVEHALGGYFHRAVHVEALSFRAFPLEVEVLGLRVDGASPDAPPFLEVPSARVRPSLAPLRGNRLVLSRVRVEGLRLRIHAYRDPPEGPGGDDIPRVGGGRGGGGRGLQVSIERLVIVGGEFILNHARVPLDLDLPKFEGRMAGRPEGGVAGHVSFGPGALRFRDAPPLPIGTEIDLVIHRGLLTVLGARIIGEGTNLAYRGRLRLSGRPQGQFSLEGPVDIALLERHIFRSGLGLGGEASWNGLLSVDGSRLRIEGRARGTDGTFRGIAVPRFATWLSYDGTSGFVMRDLDVDGLGGAASLAVDVPPTKTGRPVHVRGTVQEIDGEGALRMLFGWGEMGIGASATGDLDVSWPKGRNRLVSGRVEVDLAERPDRGTPLSGRLEWSAEDGVQTFEKADLRTTELRGQASGQVDVAGRADLSIEGETTDLVATDELFAQVRRALGNSGGSRCGPASVAPAPFSGHWGGTTSLPIFTGSLHRSRIFASSGSTGAGQNGREHFHSGAESRSSRDRSRSARVTSEICGGTGDRRDRVVRPARRPLRRGPESPAGPSRTSPRSWSWTSDATGTAERGRARPVAGAALSPATCTGDAAKAGRYYGDPLRATRLSEARWQEGTVAEGDVGGD